jgi:hypothetical protein
VAAVDGGRLTEEEAVEESLDLNMMNNFLNWVDFKFPTDFML